MKLDANNVFPPEDYATLLSALAAGSGREGFSEEDKTIFLDWCETARLDALFLEMIFDGDLVPCIKNGELHFALTEQGELRARIL